MKQRNLQDNTVDQLAQLMSLEEATPLDWSEQDLAALLKHQLDTPLEVDLMLVAKSPERLLPLTVFLAENPGITFAKLLSRKDLPLGVLNLVKQFAKWAQSATEAAVPRDVAVVLYYAAIACAKVRLGENLTQLPGDELAAGLEWTLRRPWLDARLEKLLQERNKCCKSCCVGSARRTEDAPGLK